jgi:hypothetical protein
MEWIKCSDRMPEFNRGTTEYVLVRVGDIGTKIGLLYAANGKWVINGVAFYKDAVTHWMPLPKPPKEE